MSESDKPPPPPRRSSDAGIRIPEAVLDRFRDSTIPPASTSDVEALVAEAFSGPEDEETLVPCPSCEFCSTCHGTHLVPSRIRSRFRSEPPEPRIPLHREELEQSEEAPAPAPPKPDGGGGKAPGGSGESRS